VFVTTTLIVIIFTVFIQVEYSYLVKWIFFLWSLVTHCFSPVLWLFNTGLQRYAVSYIATRVHCCKNHNLHTSLQCHERIVVSKHTHEKPLKVPRIWYFFLNE
jgi:hypothetical protein